MPIIAIAQVIVQIYFAVHAIRNGKERYWLYIIIIFPGIGSLIYFFAEYLPELQYNRRIQKARKPINSTKQLCYLKDQLELTPSVANKKALAEGFVHHGEFDNAIELYKECLSGLQQNDSALLEGISIAYFYKGDYAKAAQSLEKLIGSRDIKRNDRFELLYVRALEEQNKIEAALKEYAVLVKGFPGEEARARYALLLKKIGRKDDAKEHFGIILKNARLSDKFYLKTQKEWIGMAKKECG